MKKILKITGIIAVIVILLCNLEYALFSGDMKNNPNKALAAWYNSGATDRYCGSSPDTSLHVGTWSSIPYQVYGNYGYEHGVYLFTHDPAYGYECAPNIGTDGAATDDIYGVPYTTQYSPGGNTYPNPYPYPYYTTSPGGYTGYGPF